MSTSESHHVGKLILQGCCIYQVSRLVNSLLVCYTAHFFNYYQQQNCWHTDTKWCIVCKTKRCKPFPSLTHKTIVSLDCELVCYFLLVVWAAAWHFLGLGRKGRLAKHESATSANLFLVSSHNAPPHKGLLRI